MNLKKREYRFLKEEHFCEIFHKLICHKPKSQLSLYKKKEKEKGINNATTIADMTDFNVERGTQSQRKMFSVPINNSTIEEYWSLNSQAYGRVSSFPHKQSTFDTEASRHRKRLFLWGLRLFPTQINSNCFFAFCQIPDVGRKGFLKQVF